ncbi:hypothetical protein D9V32_13500 [Mycetocola tolaasinivorans]|uniref:DUF4355 domain-containing protein n=1 Tax=Mycetocola tolaasinivorans TaxID=76635 RepID=A0A3L7A361_9MICO|nr:hypothetical protein [Mycetocola tolaasinivorans]RLP74358.1 hypothetical protein D9V32_13500 [Mycetocola tolaasinivorans]
MAEEVAPQGAEVTAETETDWKAEARKWEKFAKENKARAEANEDAAQRLGALEEAQKSAEQKQQEALAAAQARVLELESKDLRATVAAEKSDPSKGIHVPAALLAGTTREELEASADALIAFRGEVPEPKMIVADEGKAPALALNGDGIEAAIKQALGIN